MPILKKSLVFFLFMLFSFSMVKGQKQLEYLNRGLIALPKEDNQVYLSWRLLATDIDNIQFNIYKQTDNQSAQKLNKTPIYQTTDYLDKSVDFSKNNQWIVKSVLNGKEAEEAVYTIKANQPQNPYLSIPLNIPPAGTVFGNAYTYSANDASVADLDGDGEYEIILKWDPSNSKNPPQIGFTGNQILDAYKLDGTHLWRIDLGINIRSGAAYTQFMVYDLDGDGKAELVCKTADGTKDGQGNFIGDKTKDWRFISPTTDAKYTKVVDGPEYLTVFNGLTGAAIHTVKYQPSRNPLDGWGGIGGNGGNDNSASRSDRFSACVAYLDGEKPSVVMIRGWYGRTVAAAYDFFDKQLNLRWIFDSKDSKNPYSGMANHNLTVADVDNDGKDEICVGAMTIDDNGQGLYSTGLRHGDAMHISDMDPEIEGLEVYGVHETEGRTEKLNTPGVAMFAAKNGDILWSNFHGVDVGRGVAADIDPNHLGFENWGGPGGLRNVKGKQISDKAPRSANFLVWWDADLTRELLDKNYIEKWDWESQTTKRLFTAEGCVANNGTKATPCLSADILGDWREEVIWRTADNKELRIYSTTIPAINRLTTLMHNPQYRLSIAWQNVAYNQPPHTSFYLGEGMKRPVQEPISINNKPITQP